MSGLPFSCSPVPHEIVPLSVANPYYVLVEPCSDGEGAPIWSDAAYNFMVGATATAVWEEESNNSIETATKISAHTRYYGTINTCNGISAVYDYDYYMVNLAKGSRVILNIEHPYLNTYQRLWTISFLDDGGNTLTTHNVSSDETSVMFNARGLSAGNYYVLVRPYSDESWSSAFYSFIVSATATTAWEEESNDSIETATRISTGTRHYGTMYEPNDCDYFAVSFTKPSKVTLDFRFPRRDSAEGQLTMSLLDSGGSNILTYDVASNQSRVLLTPIGLPAGEYFILVKRCSTSAWPNASYNFIVNATATVVWEKEFNDSTGIATRISTDTRYYGTVFQYNDYDYFKVNLLKANRIVLDFEHPYLDTTDNQWIVSLLDSGGNALLTRDVAGNQTTVSFAPTDLPAGVFYVRVKPYSENNWSNATYNCIARAIASNREAEPNDSTGNATRIFVDNRYYGTISHYGDYDYYKASLAKASKVVFEFQHPYLDTSYGQWTVSLLDSGGNALLTRNVAGNQTNVSLTPVGLPAGDCFVLVKPYSSNFWSSATYYFMMSATATAVWEEEWNGSISTATRISTNTRQYATVTQSGSSSSNSDYDYFMFYLTEASKVVLDFKHTNLGTSYGQWTVSLLDSGGNALLTRNVAGNQTSVSLTPVGLPAGSYYVHVKPYSSDYWSSTTYNFMVNATATDVWEREWNDSIEAATEATFNIVDKYYFGTIRHASDIDIYHISLASNKMLTFDFRHNPNKTTVGQWQVSILNSAGNTAYSMNVCGMDNVKLLKVALSADDYYICVKPYSSDSWSSTTYSFTMC